MNHREVASNRRWAPAANIISLRKAKMPNARNTADADLREEECSSRHRQ
jgi:hypothetical protein